MTSSVRFKAYKRGLRAVMYLFNLHTIGLAIVAMAAVYLCEVWGLAFNMEVSVGCRGIPGGVQEGPLEAQHPYLVTGRSTKMQGAGCYVNHLRHLCSSQPHCMAHTSHSYVHGIALGTCWKGNAVS